MTNVFIATSSGTGLEFNSDIHRAMFKDDLKEHKGSKYRIERVLKTVSDELRGYYFGAIIPVVRSTCDQWEDKSGEEVHEIIKKMLFYFEAYNPMTQRVERFGRSVMKKDDFNNTAKAMEFIDVVSDYIVQCGREVPDVAEYKRILNSAETR